ncbi:MAG: MauE/DoxX family redox-associated membrane protein [Bacteroidota bacterium]
MKRLLENTIGHRYFLLGVRIVLGFIFVFASIEKITQPEEFAKAITNYRLLPHAAVNLFAIGLPWVELLAGLFLILGLLVRGSSLLLTFLLSLFALAIAISLARGLDISCGCFGTASARKVGWTALGEDLLMLLGSLLLCYFRHTFLALETYLGRNFRATDVALPR